MRSEQDAQCSEQDAQCSEQDAQCSEQDAQCSCLFKNETRQTSLFARYNTIQKRK